MALLSRDQILSVQDRPTIDIPVPEWGGELRLKTLSGAERDAFEASILSEADDEGNRQVTMDNMRARLVAACAVDELGQRLFTPDDVEALGKKSSVALDRVYAEAQKLNRLRKSDVEELVGNSNAAPSGASTSSSPSPSGNPSENC